MANKTTPAGKSRSRAGRSSNKGGAGRFVGGLVAGAALAAGGGYLYLHHGNIGSSKPSPASSWRPPLLPSVAPKTTPKQAPRHDPPFGASEEVFEAGAHAYHAECTQCHGAPGHNATASKGAPPATQFWSEEAAAVLHGQSATDLYSKIANGSPKQGMPAYRGKLTETQLWQLSLLLASADGDLPDPVHRILTHR